MEPTTHLQITDPPYIQTETKSILLRSHLVPLWTPYLEAKKDEKFQEYVSYALFTNGHKAHDHLDSSKLSLSCRRSPI